MELKTPERRLRDTIEQLQTNVQNAEARCMDKDQQLKVLGDEFLKQHKQIEMLQGAFADMAATIRRLVTHKEQKSQQIADLQRTVEAYQKGSKERAKEARERAGKSNDDPDKGFIR